MNIQIFDDMSQCTDDAVNRMLAFVSDQRREQALKFKFTFGRFACLKSALMLQQMLADMTLIAPDEVITFEYGLHGKPSIQGYPDIHFNISHCKHGIAVAVHDQPIGIDIECFHDADEGLVKKTMNDEERQIIATADNPRMMFTHFWTQKEAVLKLRGTGIIDDLQQVLSGSEHIETHTNADKEYVWTVATN